MILAIKIVVEKKNILIECWTKLGIRMADEWTCDMQRQRVDQVSRSGETKSWENMFCFWDWTEKRAFNNHPGHGGLAEEGFSEVGSDVCRITAVFLVLSSCYMRKHKAVHETVVGYKTSYSTGLGFTWIHFLNAISPFKRFLCFPLSKSKPLTPTIPMGQKVQKHLKVIADCALVRHTIHLLAYLVDPCLSGNSHAVVLSCEWTVLLSNLDLSNKEYLEKTS